MNAPLDKKIFPCLRSRYTRSSVLLHWTALISHVEGLATPQRKIVYAANARRQKLAGCHNYNVWDMKYEAEQEFEPHAKLLVAFVLRKPLKWQQ